LKVDFKAEELWGGDGRTAKKDEVSIQLSKDYKDSK